MKLPNSLHTESHTDSSASRSNWLRAAVLGANDGIVSLAALVVGVAGAAGGSSHIFITGIAGLLAGALIPFIAILLPPASLKIPVTFAAVLVALLITGITSARVSSAPLTKVTMRVVVGGMLAMLITFGIGTLFGVATP